MEKQKAIQLAHLFAANAAGMEMQLAGEPADTIYKEAYCWAIPPSQMQDYEIDDGEIFAIQCWDYAVDHADRRGKWPSPEKLYAWNCHNSQAPAPAISLMPYRCFLAAAQLFHPMVKAAIAAKAAAEPQPPAHDPFERTVLQPRRPQDDRSIITRHQEAVGNAAQAPQEVPEGDENAGEQVEVVPSATEATSVENGAAGEDHLPEADPAILHGEAPVAHADGSNLAASPPQEDVPAEAPVKRTRR